MLQWRGSVRSGDILACPSKSRAPEEVSFP
jgi:hypothetical protein